MKNNGKNKTGKVENQDTGRYTGEPYAVIWSKAFRDPNISAQAKGLLASISTYVHSQKDFAFPSQERLADEMGVTVRTITRWIEELERAGWIERRKRIHTEQEWQGNPNATIYIVRSKSLYDTDDNSDMTYMSSQTRHQSHQSIKRGESRGEGNPTQKESPKETLEAESNGYHPKADSRHDERSDDMPSQATSIDTSEGFVNNGTSEPMSTSTERAIEIWERETGLDMHQKNRSIMQEKPWGNHDLERWREFVRDYEGKKFYVGDLYRAFSEGGGAAQSYEWIDHDCEVSGLTVTVRSDKNCGAMGCEWTGPYYKERGIKTLAEITA